MKKAPFRVLGENVVVLPDDKVDRTPGGIIMPDKTKNVPDRGVIVAVGDGYITRDAKKVPLSVSVGERVVFSPMNGIPLKHNETEYTVLREADLIVVLNEGET